MNLHSEPAVLINYAPAAVPADFSIEEGKKKTIVYSILDAHDTHTDENLLHIRFDSLTSHDITYVGIIQTARASGMEKFPMPYVLTNCHNTLCAVGGTINEDDHQFALSAAKKYGGIYVPPCYAVIHSYNREMMTKCGNMILGSDSHTRYGALGTMGIGEGGGELAKQLVNRTYDMAKPKTVLVWLTGSPKPGVGPHDVALALVGATYANGFVKNKALEFAGPGVATLSQDFRNGIDVMTTETTCWSSIWETDEKTEAYYEIRGRKEDYKKLSVQEGAYYDSWIDLDLSEIESMIALPMHPSYALAINELKKDPQKYLKEAEDRANGQLGGKTKIDLLSKIDENGNIRVDQGIIAGCSGGVYENIIAASKILSGKNVGNDEFKLSVYPDSMPAYKALAANGTIADLISSGAVFREAFCGPCFGAGDTPANGEFSIRHTTRNFPNREGSKPGEGQIASVALMDARSIAATAANQGILTAATDVVTEPEEVTEQVFDQTIYANRVYNGWGKADPAVELRFGPNIKDWPAQPALSDDILLKVVSHIDDPVTTTDELIPSGETSSFRSNPLRLAEFTLSRRDPAYVGCAKEVHAKEETRLAGGIDMETGAVCDALAKAGITADPDSTNIASAIYARKPGDGSAREQAASCQRVLGGAANFAEEYATKRYRSNCINWGILPFVTEDGAKLEKDTWVFIKNIRASLLEEKAIEAYAVTNDEVSPVTLSLGALTPEEKQILADGCLINYYRN
ncbi:MAG: hydratase [Solobacterium sp.]|nr:hydratase [Solobacterium sp.]